MESVLAREDVELACKKGKPTAAALLAGVDHDEAIAQVGDIALDGLCTPRGFVHIVLESFDVR